MWTNPTYNRDAVDQRHGRWIPRFRRLEPKPKMVESCKQEVAPLALNAPCWSGWCRKCGRPLISAVDRADAPPDKYECGICE